MGHQNHESLCRIISMQKQFVLTYFPRHHTELSQTGGEIHAWSLMLACASAVAFTWLQLILIDESRSVDRKLVTLQDTVTASNNLHAKLFVSQYVRGKEQVMTNKAVQTKFGRTMNHSVNEHNHWDDKRSFTFPQNQRM